MGGSRGVRRPVAVGIDLAGAPHRRTGFCELGPGLTVRTVALGGDESILAAVRAARPAIVAIDAPLSLPRGRRSLEARGPPHLRECDRDLQRLGIRFFPLTLGPMRQLTARGIHLAGQLRAEGYVVIEAYPGGAQDVLGLPRKGEGEERLRRALLDRGFRGDVHRRSITHDELDAIACAFTGREHIAGRSLPLGDPSEGLLVLPRPRSSSGRWTHRHPPRRFPTHPAVRGFDRAAARYERSRPGYPAAAIRTLGRALRLGPGRTVVELGSGTGKFTRALAPLGAAIVAVEPTAGMRREFARAVRSVAVLPGSAESIPLPGRFADAVVAAQAFHWFRPDAALPEIARVLRPGGGLGLVWNRRDEAGTFSRGLGRILDQYAGASPRGRDRGWQRRFGGRGSPFGPLHVRRFRHRQRLTPEGVVERALSVSYIALLPPATRRSVAREVRRLLEDDPTTLGRRHIDLPYSTELYWARRRGAAPGS